MDSTFCARSDFRFFHFCFFPFFSVSLTRACKFFDAREPVSLARARVSSESRRPVSVQQLGGLCVFFFYFFDFFIFAFLRDNLRLRKGKVSEAVKRWEFPRAKYRWTTARLGTTELHILYTAARTRCSAAIAKTGSIAFLYMFLSYIFS